jgi:hypothetical protein
MSLFTLIAQAPSLQDAIGTIDTPPGIEEQMAASGNSSAGVLETTGNSSALLFFISNLLKIGTILAGVWVLFNVLLAGYDFISSQGKSDAYSKVKDKLTMSLVGLLLIIGAYTITAVLSLVLFGDAGYILNPEF